MNFTIPVPNGTTNHGEQGLVCIPPKWTDLLTFFVTNYFAHAATVVSTPGQSTFETVTSISCALFAPGSGALRTLRYFELLPVFKRNRLKRAVAAGAVCMVVSKQEEQKKSKKSKADLRGQGDEEQGGLEMQTRHRTRRSTSTRNLDDSDSFVTAVDVAIDHAPDDHGDTGETVPLTDAKSNEDTDDWYSRIFEGEMRPIPKNRKFYGWVELPKGDSYELVEVPAGTPLKAYGATEDFFDPRFRIGVSYSVPKILIGFFQAILAIRTLYQAQGDQLDLYGYAAFGLSVAPYAFMSITNILASLATPEYPTMFLVHTPDLDNACRDGGKFVGILAAVDIDKGITLAEKIKTRTDGGALLVCVLGFIFISTPIAIVGGLSKFQLGSISTTADRGWLMSWLVSGSLSSLWLQAGSPYLAAIDDGPVAPILFLVLFCPFFIPAIGGMVTVGRMLQSYGICSEVGQ